MYEVHFVPDLHMNLLQDEFSGVITKALSTLVLGLETRLEMELANMARLPWATLEGVGDQSEYASLPRVFFLITEIVLFLRNECFMYV